MNDRFDGLPWHDATLLRVHIDRTSPGERDEVVFDVRWPDDTDQALRFRDCYAFEATLNFGIIAPESILEARCVAESSQLAELRGKWAKLGVKLNDLRCFEVRTNSTAGVLRVFAHDFALATLGVECR